MAAIDYSCMYKIVGPDGTVVSFNDDSDPNFCGYLDTITGLDCAEVRENAQNNVASSGGMHDNFYLGRLPWSFSGTIQPSILSNSVQEEIQRAVNKATNVDARLLWTPTGSTEERMVRFRVQQPTRMSGRVPKTFQIQGVGADYRILSSNLNSVQSASGNTPLTVSVTNIGDEDADVRFLVTGPINADKLILSNLTTGKKVQFLPGVIGIPSGSGLATYTGSWPIGVFFCSTNPRTFQDYLGYNVAIGEASGNQDQYPYVDPLNTDWTIAVAPGANEFELQADGSGASTSLTVQWYDSWV
jgi:hypothetical protein